MADHTHKQPAAIRNHRPGNIKGPQKQIIIERVAGQGGLVDTHCLRGELVPHPLIAE